MVQLEPVTIQQETEDSLASVKSPGFTYFPERDRTIRKILLNYFTENI